MAKVYREHVFCDVHLRDGDENEAQTIAVAAAGVGIPDDLAGSYTVDLCPKCAPELARTLTELLKFASGYGRPEKTSRAKRRQVNGSHRQVKGTRQQSNGTKELPPGESTTNGVVATGGLQCDEPGCHRVFEGKDAARRRGAHAWRSHGRRSPSKSPSNAKPTKTAQKKTSTKSG